MSHSHVYSFQLTLHHLLRVRHHNPHHLHHWILPLHYQTLRLLQNRRHHGCIKTIVISTQELLHSAIQQQGQGIAGGLGQGQAKSKFTRWLFVLILLLIFLVTTRVLFTKGLSCICNIQIQHISSFTSSPQQHIFNKGIAIASTMSALLQFMLLSALLCNHI